MTTFIDTAVVGAGAAGLSTALFLGRAGRSTVVFDGGRPRIFAVNEIRELLGFDAMSTAAFMARSRDEVLQYGVKIAADTVQRISPRDGGFEVVGSTQSLLARTVVLATGLVDDLPPLFGVRKPWGQDLRICPCFDGHEVRGQRFVVFGEVQRLAQMASWVWMWSKNVTVVTDQPLSEPDLERLRLLDIAVHHDVVIGLDHKDGRLVSLAAESGAVIPCEAAWLAAPMRAASGLARSLCEVDALGFAKTDSAGRTSRSGVFAIGNASDPVAHLAHAVASGTNAGPYVTLHLLESEISDRRNVAAAGADRLNERTV